jgi:hypothetical protein
VQSETLCFPSYVEFRTVDRIQRPSESKSKSKLAFIRSCSLTRLTGHSSPTCPTNTFRSRETPRTFLSCTVCINRCAVHSGTWLAVFRRREDRRRTEWAASPVETVPVIFGRVRSRGQPRLELDASAKELSCRCCNLPAETMHRGCQWVPVGTSRPALHWVSPGLD